jgi:hypothetical protein
MFVPASFEENPDLKALGNMATMVQFEPSLEEGRMQKDFPGEDFGSQPESA